MNDELGVFRKNLMKVYLVNSDFRYVG